MGATTFINTVNGATLQEAFADAVKQAQYDYGHAGYTGTIAEKNVVTLIQRGPVPKREAIRLAQELIEDADARIDDKWGPAGAIPLEEGGWLVFGWASE